MSDKRKAGPERSGSGLTRRQVLAGIAIPGLVMGTYGTLVEPFLRLHVKRYAPDLPRWPKELQLRAAIIADPHLNKPFMPGRWFRRIIARTNALKPDIVFLLGDYASGLSINYKEYSFRAVAEMCAEFRSPLGTIAVMGNHDWWADTFAPKTRKGPLVIQKEMGKVGITSLENDAVRLEKDGHPFWVAGLGDQLAFPDNKGGYEGVDDLPATVASITDDAPAILLAHEPDIFPKVSDRFSITLSGHTHGGQIAIAGYAPFVPSRYGQRYRYGHIVEDDRHLIVSAGLGCTGIPVRIGVPPEIVLLELGGEAVRKPGVA
ncbi:MAG: metallophosphoesterase [Geminicoccaceae bacterium]|nr:metallophosphoesterase [Geminicoccaceae bacterium]